MIGAKAGCFGVFFLFPPPGTSLNEEVPTERMNLHVDRLQTSVCMCVCQREKLIKEKR